MGDTALVFDLDGTLVDSGDIKQRAYRAAIDSVLQRPESSVLQAYRAYGTLNRAPQLRAAFSDLAERSPTDAEQAAMLAAYGDLVEREQSSVVPFPGIREFLADRCGRSFLAVASNAPQHEVEASCARLNLAAYFDLILGFPTSKERAIEAVRTLSGLPSEAITYIGDRREDEAPALGSGVHFLRFGPLEPEDGTEILRDVAELASALDSGAE